MERFEETVQWQGSWVLSTANSYVCAEQLCCHPTSTPSTFCWPCQKYGSKSCERSPAIAFYRVGIWGRALSISFTNSLKEDVAFTFRHSKLTFTFFWLGSSNYPSRILYLRFFRADGHGRALQHSLELLFLRACTTTVAGWLWPRSANSIGFSEVCSISTQNN